MRFGLKADSITNRACRSDYNFGLDDDAPDYELQAAERAAYAPLCWPVHDRVKEDDHCSIWIAVLRQRN